MRTLSVLFTAFLLGNSLTAAEPAYIHPETRLEIPESLGLFKCSEGQFHADRSLGAILAFHAASSEDCQVTLYLSVKKGTPEEQIAEVKAAILEIEKRATYSKVRFSEPVAPADNARAVSATLRMHQEEDQDVSVPVKSHILLVTLPDNLTLKARLTCSADFAGYDEHVASLHKEVLRLAGMAKKPSK